MVGPLALASAVRLAHLVEERAVSSRELLRLYLDRVERLNPALNAVVTLEAERAEAEAFAADQATARGESTGPLHGLPFTVKDAIEVGGVRSTGGSASLRDHVPGADAPAVGRLRAAGAVVFGKTNCPAWSSDIQTFNDLFGTTNNPWDARLTPGGSSGGAAAAVAAGMTAFDLGSDIGGSVRIPADFCGVCAHKPSFGLVSQLGYLDRVGGGTTGTDLNVFGPLARHPGDLELLLGVLAGPDPADSPAWNVQLPPPRHRDLAGYRVGLWLDDPGCRVDGPVLDCLESAAEALARAGATVSRRHPALSLTEMEELFTSLLLPAVSPSVAGPAGRAVAGNHRDWLELKVRQARVRRVWADWFGAFDALLCPVVPMLPFPHDHHGDMADRYVTIAGEACPLSATLAWTGLVGLAGLPSTVVPVGRVPGPTGTEVPVGVQVVGPYLEDRSAIFLAGRLSELTGGVTAPPSVVVGRSDPDL